MPMHTQGPTSSQSTTDPAPSVAPAPAAVTDASAPAWTETELAELHERDDKAERVRNMFASIADSYDLNNRVHSLWRDQAWRKFAVKQAGVKPGDRCLDCACGTGDLTQALAATEASEVIGLDFTQEMLDLAEVKRTAPKGAPKNADKITYLQGDAMALPFDDNSFDVLTIAFGVRNVQSPAKAVAEFHRVLRPGGRLVILEFDTPAFPPLRWFNDFYCGWVMPRTATLIARDRSGAYKYLPKSVGAFMSRTALKDLMATTGFNAVTAKGLSLGICVCYRGIAG